MADRDAMEDLVHRYADAVVHRNVALTPGMMLAHYDDSYVLTDSGWLFASGELVPHSTGPADLSAPFLNAWA